MGTAGVMVVIWVLLWLTLVAYVIIITLMAGSTGEIPRFPSDEFVTLGVFLVLFTTLAAAWFAAILGALMGLALGTVNSLLLGTLTWAFYRPSPADAQEYRKMAGRVCALASVAILAVDWLFHAFPELDEFAPWRIREAIIGPANFIPPNDELFDTVSFADFWSFVPIVSWAILPVLGIALAMRWSGRLTAGWY